MNNTRRTLATNVSMSDVNSLSYDGIVSRDSLAVPFIKRLSDTDTETGKVSLFSFDNLSKLSLCSSTFTSSSLLAPFDKDSLTSSFKKKPKEEISILDQKFVRFAMKNEKEEETAIIRTNNDDNDIDDDDDDSHTNTNTTKHDSILWRWVIVHKDKINDSPPKRRRRHHRRSNNMDFTAEILPCVFMQY